MKLIKQVCDFLDPDDSAGRTYREINNSRSHKFDVGDLVEVNDGVRLFIVHRNRDCDGTPLYCLSPDQDNTAQLHKNLLNRDWHNGYSERNMKLIKKGNNND